MGRPLELDELRAKAFRDAVARGVPRRFASALAGVSYATIKSWLARGRKGQEPFAAFLALVEKADADALDRNLTRVQEGEQGWQGAAWWLERRHPRLFPKQWVTESANDKADDLTHAPFEDLERDIGAAAALIARKKTG